MLLPLALALGGCGHDGPRSAPSATPDELKPTDGRNMGTAKLADEKCEAVYDEVTRDGKGRLFSNLSDALKLRMGPPDGVREHGETYWLAVSKDGTCNEYTAGADGSIGHGTAVNDLCGLPKAPEKIGPPTPRRGR